MLTHGDRGGSYRAIPRISFALEHQIFGTGRPGIGHVINLLFYFLVLVLLHITLLRILKVDERILFLGLLLFCLHPVHVEVVASLKNRDILLAVIFAFSSVLMATKYYYSGKLHYLGLCALFYLLSITSKETTYSFVALAPLMLFFNARDQKTKWSRIFIVTGTMIGTIVTFLILIRFLVPNIVTFHVSYQDAFWQLEHPLIFVDSLNIKLGSALNSLLAYFGLFVFPHPLSFFYGYDTVRIEGLMNFYPILSAVFHLAILILSLRFAVDRHPLAFAGLFYLLSIFIFSNLVFPLPGIIAERYFFIPSIGACIALGHLLGWLIGKNKKLPKVIGIGMVSMILIAYSVKSFTRASLWKDKLTVARIDAANNPDAILIHAYILETLVYEAKSGYIATEDYGDYTEEVIEHATALISKAPYDERTYAFGFVSACQFGIPLSAVMDDELRLKLRQLPEGGKTEEYIDIFLHVECSEINFDL